MCSEGLRERYVNPYTDFAFKLLFGTDLNKEILIGFLNALFDGKQVIEDVTYLNTEHLGSKETDRRAVFDVYCENEKWRKDSDRNAERGATVFQGPEYLLCYLSYQGTGY